MLNQELLKRNIPPLKSTEEMLEILQNEIYGRAIPVPESLSFSEPEEILPRFLANKSTFNKIIASGTLNGREFSFPFYAVVPREGKNCPFFIHINFRPDIPDRYQPTEELIDNGFAVFTVHYEDVTSDDGDFTNGLAGTLYPNGKREDNSPGKIAMWAWAAQRVMDYCETLGDTLDFNRSIVCGHSRLGKTALFTAATDERFKFAYSNNAGCAGDALARGTSGETVKQIWDRFPFWFCENYKKYCDNESQMPFDQHYLIASVAPRFVMVGSAADDWWACPKSQQLACLGASPAFKNGLSCPKDRFAEVGEAFLDGDLGYHLRAGTHFFSRTDWLRLMEFVNKKA